MLTVVAARSLAEKAVSRARSASNIAQSPDTIANSLPEEWHVLQERESLPEAGECLFRVACPARGRATMSDADVSPTPF